jgi:hypothetical protein
MAAAMKNVMKRALRRVAKPVLSKIRNVIAEIESSPTPRDFSKEDTPYPWLNWLLETSVRKSQGRLRPNYTWAMLQAAHLAKTLGIPRISAIEFGVAGGNGLLALEDAAVLVKQEMAIEVDVYGFDTGAGLPRPLDYRDLPNLFTETDYQMDVEKLKARLKRARLILGLVQKTVPEFLLSNPAPIGFISIDVDYYTSTAEVLAALECDQDLLLPRIHCYFDDIMGFTFSEYTGERLAIAEFNDSHQMRKISPIFGLKYFLPRRYFSHLWCEQMYIAHIFDHDLYGRDDGLVIRHNDAFAALRQICLAPLLTFLDFADVIPMEAMMC